MYVLHSWNNECTKPKNVCDGQMSPLPECKVGLCDFEGHVKPAVSVRPLWKTHERQLEVHHESANSLNVFVPLLRRTMDEETVDDKEEQSEDGADIG